EHRIDVVLAHGDGGSRWWRRRLGGRRRLRWLGRRFGRRFRRIIVGNNPADGGRELIKYGMTKVERKQSPVERRGSTYQLLMRQALRAIARATPGDRKSDAGA